MLGFAVFRGARPLSVGVRLRVNACLRAAHSLQDVADVLRGQDASRRNLRAHLHVESVSNQCSADVYVRVFDGCFLFWQAGLPHGDMLETRRRDCVHVRANPFLAVFACPFRSNARIRGGMV